MINRVGIVDSKEVIVSDKSILIGLNSPDDDILQDSQRIIEFQSWRKYEKKILTIPSIYHDLHNKVSAYDLVKAYFENYFDNTEEIIGTSDKNPIEVEFHALIQNLWFKGYSVIFISEDERLREAVRKECGDMASIKDIQSAASLINKKKTFYDFMYYKYYDTSGV